MAIQQAFMAITNGKPNERQCKWFGRLASKNMALFVPEKIFREVTSEFKQYMTLQAIMYKPV